MDLTVIGALVGVGWLLWLGWGWLLRRFTDYLVQK